MKRARCATCDPGTGMLNRVHCRGDNTGHTAHCKAHSTQQTANSSKQRRQACTAASTKALLDWRKEINAKR